MKRREYLKLSFSGGVALLFGIKPKIATATEKKIYNNLSSDIVKQIKDNIIKEAKDTIKETGWKGFYVFINAGKECKMPTKIKIIFDNKKYEDYEALLLEKYEREYLRTYEVYPAGEYDKHSISQAEKKRRPKTVEELKHYYENVYPRTIRGQEMLMVECGGEKGERIMPYRIDPNNPKIVQHKKGGRWKYKQRCSSNGNAKAAIRLLRGLKHGMKLKKT